ncbi:imelysin family protein [Algibacter lectus]|uniref:imelysin family protein n=1 Tax=Algibacter lectus TaxID=221126 RepID=UPI0026EDA535|nr:imelysin family protein [Algibacter lectus]MDO7136509.1 imelysin family protein [Algibacter lectus]
MRNLSILFLSFLLFTCNSSDDNTKASFKVDLLLVDVVNQNILPAVDYFASESVNLNTAVETYLAASTEFNLEALRVQWQVSAKAYGSIYAFNIGDVRGQFMHQALFNWPTLPTAIENILINNEVVDEALVLRLSPQIKTLSGLEYLLFGDDLSTVNAAFVSSEKRRNYLKYTASELKSQSERLQGIWGTANSAAYGSTFIANQETGIKGSFNLLYNGLFNLIDNAKITKIGKPAGLENSDNVNPEISQAYFSHTSLAIIENNIKSLEAVYFNPNGLGISDYVYATIDNDELNNAVEAKIAEVYAAIDAIPTNFYTAITSNPEEVENLHEKLGELGVLFSVDVRSILSIIITTTDNDGD